MTYFFQVPKSCEPVVNSCNTVFFRTSSRCDSFFRLKYFLPSFCELQVAVTHYFRGLISCKQVLSQFLFL